MPALLARPGVQSLLLQQRSPSSSAQGWGTPSWGWAGAGNGSNPPWLCSSPALGAAAAAGARSKLPSLDGTPLVHLLPGVFFPADVMEKQMKWRTQKLKGTLKERTGF